MAEPFIGQISIVGFNFAPRGWAMCDGQLLSIAQNTALFALLGTMYGGNGTTTFALPNLRGRVPIHVGQGTGLANRVQGEVGGSENVTLTAQQMPTHSHPVKCQSQQGNLGSPVNAYHAGDGTGFTLDYADTADANMNAGSLGNTGGNQPHPNMPPFLALNFVIALQGIFPARN